MHYSSCQGGHATKAMLSAVYGLDPQQVRVIVPDVGGGFGVKSRTYPEEAVLGFYARAARPTGAMVGDPHREHALDAAGPGAGAAGDDRRHA